MGLANNVTNVLVKDGLLFCCNFIGLFSVTKAYYQGRLFFMGRIVFMRRCLALFKCSFNVTVLVNARQRNLWHFCIARPWYFVTGRILNVTLGVTPAFAYAGKQGDPA